MSAEFSSSSYALLNDEILDMVKSPLHSKYLSDGPTVAADFINQMVGDRLDRRRRHRVSTAFGQRFTAEARTSPDQHDLDQRRAARDREHGARADPPHRRDEAW